MAAEPEGDGDGNGDVDDALGAALGLVPKGSQFDKFLKQFGVVGLGLAVLIGNIPVTAAITAAASGKGNIDSNTFATYWDVFLLVTPWVAVFAIIVYCIATKTLPQMSGAGYLFAFGFLVAGAGFLSYSLGGPVPTEVLVGPTQGGPAGAGAYALTGLGSYLELYGPWPVIAGILEGGFFGYWAAVISSDEVAV